MPMGVLDAIVGRYFRDEKVGRMVSFPVGRRIQSYVVGSESEELKIRAFLKMYYCAEWSIQLVSLVLTITWITGLTLAPENSTAHIIRSGAIFLGIYSVVVGIPYWLLWRTYRKELLNFVSAQEEVDVAGKREGRQPWLALVVLIAMLLMGLIAFYLVGAK
jgi:hypothetical protein